LKKRLGRRRDKTCKLRKKEGAKSDLVTCKGGKAEKKKIKTILPELVKSGRTRKKKMPGVKKNSLAWKRGGPEKRGKKKEQKEIRFT